ncbi:MAG: HEAT repeat domain-containing protein [Planctomycetes bacterium]|nr:HEAT repeat domain-containing protein [Planctomycetota bacterium]
MERITQSVCSVFLLAAALGAGGAAEDSGAHPANPPHVNRAERRAEIERLVKKLKNEVWAEREEAAAGLRKFGTEALPQLTALQADDDHEFAARVAALIQEARLGANGQLGEAVSEMLRAYPNQDAGQREATVAQLVRRAGAGAAPLLLGLLDTENDEQVLAAIMGQLSYLSPGADGLKALLKFYAHAPESIKGQVLQALAAIPSEEARAAVREALNDGPSSIKAWAVQAAQRLGDRGCLPGLRKLAAGAADEDHDLQIQAIGALTGLLDEEAGPVFRKLLDGPKEVQAAALNGLAGIHDRGSAALLIQLLKDESKKELHEQIVDAMGPIGDPGFVPLLKERLKSDQASMRISALNSLRLMNACEAADEIAEKLGDDDAEVQKAAAEAVAAFGHKASIPALKKLLSAADMALQHQAAKALANLGDAEGLERLIATARKLPQAVEEGGEAYRSAAESVSLLGQWQVPGALAVLRDLAHGGDETVLWALLQFNFDEEAFRALLKTRLLAHLERPGNSNAEMSLAMFLKHRGLDEAAIKHLENVLRKRPSNPTALDRLASAYHEAGRYAECEAAYARLEALEGVNATFFNNRAWFHCTAFSKDFLKPDLALSLAQRAVALSPRSEYIIDTLGWSFHVSGKYDDAVRELRRALELKDGADLPGRAWERTRIARSLAAEGKKDEAFAEVTRALAEAPGDARVLQDAAGFFAAQGRRDEAVDALHKCIDAGWIEVAPMELNPEFDSLRQDPGYEMALKRVKQSRDAVRKIVEDVEAQVRKDLKPRPAGAEAADENEDEAPDQMQEGDLWITE